MRASKMGSSRRQERKEAKAAEEKEGRIRISGFREQDQENLALQVCGSTQILFKLVDGLRNIALPRVVNDLVESL